MRKTFRKKGVAFALALSMLCSLGWAGNVHAEEADGTSVTESVEVATDLDAQMVDEQTDENEFTALPVEGMDEVTVESDYYGLPQYLFKTADGYDVLLWGVGNDATDDVNHLVWQKYDDDFNLQSSTLISNDYIYPNGAVANNFMTFLGGIYEGADYNFVVAGQNNLNEDDTLCTLRVAKFSKDWSFISACDISNQDDVEIYYVFTAGGFDVAEKDGNLWISMARTGYGSGMDDIHHQGKMNLIVRISDMKLLGSAADFFHSFSQYLTVCNDQVYQCEMSEGTRKILVERLEEDNYTGGWNYNWAAGAEDVTSVLDCWTSDAYGMWSYPLYAETDGFSSSDTHGRLLSAYSTMDQEALQQNGGDAQSLSYSYNYWVASTTTDLGETTRTQLTNLSDSSLGYCHMVKINDNKFVLLWEIDKDNSTTVQYVCVDAYANRLTDTVTVDAELSTTQPISDGKGNVVWSIKKNVEVNGKYPGRPVFYTLNVDNSTIAKRGPYAQDEQDPTPAPECNITYNGIYISKSDHTGVTAIMDVQLDGDASCVDYSWYATKDNGATWIQVADWNGNRFINWTPEESGDYVLVGKVRKNGDDAGAISKAANFSFHPAIKGICQMPYTGDGGGYLIGVESYDNPGNAYSYEMLILDCTLLAQNKPAWIYTTGQCKTSGSCLWTIWQPQYGYYWTLFRIYDENGTMIDEKCYPFVNAY